MKKHQILLILLIVGMASSIIAQIDNVQNNHKQHKSSWCGTTLQDNILIKERMMKNRVDMANWVDTRTAVTWVPIKFHLVGNAAGGDHVSELKVFDMLCAINEDYADQDIQFFIKDGTFNYLNNATANTNPRSFAGDFQLSAARVNNALNIFIVKTIPSFGGGGNTLGFFDPSNSADWIVLQRDQVSGPAAETLTHELGHFFSLPHTFLGWDGEYWDQGEHGIPVGPLSPGGIPNEYVNGSNCTSAGDGICDTKANYGLGFGYPNCNYTGPCQDPNGDLLSTVVQEENYMAYFIGCASEFTPDQKSLINIDLNSAKRNYLGAGNEIPPSEDITATPVLIEPINGEVTPLFNVVDFDWDPVAGATHYLLEVDRTNTFSFAPETKVVTGTSTFLEDVFDDNRTYYWRVKPFSKGNPCGPETGVESFKTGTVSNVNEIASVKEWTVSPNPIHNNQILNIEVITDSSFDAEVKLYNVSGKLIKNQAHNFAAGSSNLPLNIESLSMGMYLLHVESESGVLTHKIVVTK